MFNWFQKKKRATVLLVDDESAVILPLKERLEANDYEVITACNGQQGLVRAITRHPDLILLDTNMPYMTGIQMLERLREHHAGRHMTVMMVTGCKVIDNVNNADKLGVEDYVTKPFNTHELMMKIENLLQRKGVLEPV